MTSQTITALGTSIINLINRKTPIATASTVGMVKPDGNTININADGVISSNGGSGSGLQMFDTVIKDHILTFEESKGLALQGTYVYKTGVSGSRYGYLDFYNKCVEEYQNGAKENYYLKSNVNEIGSVVNNKGVLNNFSTTNYATIPNDFTPSTNSWEISLKFTTGSDVSTTQNFITFGSSDFIGFLGYITSGSLKLYANSTSSWNVAGGTNIITVTANTTYWVKYIYDGTQYLVKTSTNGVDYTTSLTVANASPLNFSGSVNIGKRFNGEYFRGTIDLNECYIKVNDSVWWTGVTKITTYKNTNGHTFYDISQKDLIDEIFNNTGSAWFYGVDTENERIFLPRNNNFVQLASNTSDVNSFVEAGLPNIEGSVSTSGVGAAYQSPSGAFKSAIGSYGAIGNFSGSWSLAKTLTLNASNSSEVYGNSDTVQPAAVKHLLYICVGNTEVTSSITNVTEITTSENDTIPLFTAHYFDFTPNNPSWLKAGTQQNSGGIYTTAYNTLVNCLTDNIYNIKVIDTANMIAGVDYSEFWKVDQTNMTFTTPTASGVRPMGEISAVVGNGISLGLTDGTNNAGLWWDSNVGGNDNINAYGVSIGQYVSNNPQLNFNNRAIGVTTDPKNSGLIAKNTSTSQLYFKVANAVQNLELLNVGEVMEAVADKISRQDCKAYITETYQNGSSWYRVWSDGWCEQGGINTQSIGSQSTVNLLKNYKDTSYLVMVSNQSGSLVDNIANKFQINIYNKTTSSFGTWVDSSFIGQCWETKGYIK